MVFEPGGSGCIATIKERRENWEEIVKEFD